jgi:DNA-binding transcriptional regulator LsrR (DeoR family)
MKKNNQPAHPLESKLQKVEGLLEHLIAVEMYKGGATQDDIAAAMKVSKGKVNGLVKGVKPPKNHDEN